MYGSFKLDGKVSSLRDYFPDGDSGTDKTAGMPEQSRRIE